MKTKPTDESVEAFLACVDDDERREDCWALLEMMEDVTGEEATMWGKSIIGFGSYHYKYESGREGDWFLVGFSPRKRSLSLYIMSGFSEYEDMMANLGTCTKGKSCLYVKRLADVNATVLKELIDASVAYMRETYNTGDTVTTGDMGKSGDTGDTGNSGVEAGTGNNGQRGAPVLRD